MVDAGSQCFELACIPTPNSVLPKSFTHIGSADILALPTLDMTTKKLWGKNFKNYFLVMVSLLNRQLSKIPQLKPLLNEYVLLSTINCSLSLDKFWEQFDMILQATMWAIPTMVPSNIPYSPEQMVFGIDMIFWQKSQCWLATHQQKMQSTGHQK